MATRGDEIRLCETVDRLSARTPGQERVVARAGGVHRVERADREDKRIVRRGIVDLSGAKIAGRNGDKDAASPEALDCEVERTVLV